MLRTKIICMPGMALDGEDTIRALAAAGATNLLKVHCVGEERGWR